MKQLTAYLTTLTRFLAPISGSDLVMGGLWLIALHFFVAAISPNQFFVQVILFMWELLAYLVIVAGVSLYFFKRLSYIIKHS